eukprot:16443499-Heterocapsa_arctica.AAC.1
MFATKFGRRAFPCQRAFRSSHSHVCQCEKSLIFPIRKPGSQAARQPGSQADSQPASQTVSQP